jgi:DNA-binding beta-propeller fold protein YncE
MMASSRAMIAPWRTRIGSTSGAVLGLLVGAGCGHSQRLVLFAGGGTGGDGARATEARLEQPFAVAIDPTSGEHYLAEFRGNRVRKIDRAGVISTVIGPGAPGEAGQISLKEPHHLLFPPGGGDLFVADTFNNRILRYSPRTGAVVVFAPGVTFGKTFCLAFDPRGERLYVAETSDDVIRWIDLKSMAVWSVHGTFPDPRAVAVDSKGNVYVLSRKGHTLSVIDGSGKTRRVAGTGQKGYSGDGGDPLRADMNGPKHLTVDGEDNVLIADTENHVIRKLLVRENKLVKVAGTGAQGAGALPAPPAAAALARPHGVVVAPDGAVLISDSWNDRVLELRP